MKLPAKVEQLAARFDALSLRERALTTGAILAAALMIWTIAILDPISGKHRALVAEQEMLQEQIGALQSGSELPADDPRAIAKAREQELQRSIDEVNAELASNTAGLIPPEQMVKVIQDVLQRQRGVQLVSLHNNPVASLAPPIEPADGADAASGEAQQTRVEATPIEVSGPFVHPVEIIVEGAYLDVLAYLQALEALDWRFYWKVLELETKQYPTNRVRIELTTLSMDKDWIGV